MTQSDKLRLLFCAVASVGAVGIAGYALADKSKPKPALDIGCTAIEYGPIITSIRDGILETTVPLSAFNGGDVKLLCRLK